MTTKDDRDDKPTDRPAPSEGAKPGSERARDEQRDGGGPRYAGGSWKAADERAPEERFGHTRADDSGHDGKPDPALQELPSSDLDEDDEVVESSGAQEGMHRPAVSGRSDDK